MKMNKNEYLRSMARHATLLCCIVPFIAAVSAKAEAAYRWDSATYTKSGETVNDLEITLSQTASINGQSFSFNKFDARSFGSDFQGNLSGIDPSLLNNQTWNLSRVIVEISATVDNASVSFDIANDKMSSVSSISGAGSPVIQIGTFVLDASDLKESSGSNPGTLTSVWSSTPTVVTGNDSSRVSYSFKGGLSETLDSAVDAMTLSSFLGSDTVTGTAGTDFSDLAVSVKGGTPFTGMTDIETENLSSSLTLTGLSLNIRYIVTPEPGTMALLLTGIPLFLVRRRKSWKK